jgi:hypothetical protein
MKKYVIKYWYTENSKKKVGSTVTVDVETKIENIFEMKCENMLLAINKLIAICKLENKSFFQINSIEAYNIPPEF